MDYIKLNQRVIVDDIIFDKDLVIECVINPEYYDTPLGKVPKECASVVHPFYFTLDFKYYSTVYATDYKEATKLASEAIGQDVEFMLYDEDSWTIKRDSSFWKAALYCGIIKPDTTDNSLSLAVLYNMEEIPLSSVKQKIPNTICKTRYKSE